MAVLLLADRGFEGNRLLRYAHDLTHLVNGHIDLVRDLVGSRLVAVLMEELTLYLLDLVDGLHHMDGDADGSRLIRDRARDRLSDPPCRVGGELEALGVVELFDRLDQSEVALLNQIEELHTSAEVALRDADNKTEVRFGKALSCRDIAVGDADREVDLLLGGKQRHLADVLEVHLDGVVDRDTRFRSRRSVFVVLVLIIGDLEVLDLDIAHVIDDLDALVVERLIKLFKLFGIQIRFADRIQNILVGQLTALLFG